MNSASTPMFVGRIHASKYEGAKSWFHLLQGTSLLKLEYTSIHAATDAQLAVLSAHNAHEVKSDKLLLAIRDAIQEASHATSRQVVPAATFNVPDESKDTRPSPVQIPGIIPENSEAGA